MGQTTYKDSGVDLELYEQAMERLPRWMHRTYCPRVLRNDGGFAGLFSLDFKGNLFSRKYQEPVLVSGTDGVGTKLKVAQLVGQHGTIGLDLVAMCVNDILCCGAEPLFFLDYVAMSRDNPPLLEAIVRGISDGCVEAGCALLGGETAIMPDVYHGEDYDLAGFCVGVVDKPETITGKEIRPGDLVVGVSSSGVHSNGYSLARKIVFEKAKLNVDSYVADLGTTVGEELLRPTKIYASLVRNVLNHYRVKNVIHGIGHITGGGLLDNTERILPTDVDLVFKQSWDLPPVFQWMQRLGEVPQDEMFRVFNMGVGLTFIVSPYYAQSVMDMAKEAGNQSWVIGEAVVGNGKSRWAS